VTGIMNKFNTFEAFEEEKGWGYVALHSAMHCEVELGQNQGRVLDRWRNCCHKNSRRRNLGGSINQPTAKVKWETEGSDMNTLYLAQQLI